MTGIVTFQALAFDLVDGRLVEGPLVQCGSPMLAIRAAEGQWKVFCHVGAVAFSRLSFFDGGAPAHKHVLRRFGQVPDEYLAVREHEEGQS
jgi:hypothetical protein